MDGWTCGTVTYLVMWATLDKTSSRQMGGYSCFQSCKLHDYEQEIVLGS